MPFWQKFVVVLLASVILAGATSFTRLALRPEGWRAHVPWVTYVHPSVAKLKAAQRLVDGGQRAEAREILVNALTNAPNSSVTRELRDLLGEINTELFFSTQSSPRKTEYTIKHGDTLSSIARMLQSSTDAIRQINKLDSTLIRTGDKLLVPQLDFTITVDLPRERVVVHDSHGFFAQYPIASADLPSTRVAQVETRVQAKSFWLDGQPVSSSQGTSKEGSRRIYLRSQGYILYGVEETSEESESKIAIEDEGDSPPPAPTDTNRPAQGIAMLKKDIDQLELLIRNGTPVTIILDRQ